jgi:hypothetical protein
MYIPNKSGELKNVPVTENEDGKNVIDGKFHGKIKDYLLDREGDIYDYAPQKWDEETRGKVNRIVAILTNNPVVEANKNIASAEKSGDDDYFDDDSESETVSESSSTNEDDFFDDF